MRNAAGDVRGHCNSCARWFSIPSDTVHAMLHALCPFCSGTADQIEQRCGDTTIAVDVAAAPVTVTPDAAAV